MHFSPTVLDHFTNPRHTGVIENPDVQMTMGSSTCGDQVTFYLKVDPETRTITDLRFLSYGCAANIASASMVSELAIGKTLSEAAKITWKVTVAALGGLPPEKSHCSELSVNTLMAAIALYQKNHGDKE